MSVSSQGSAIHPGEGEPAGITIYRLYREEGLTVRKRRTCPKAARTPAPTLVEPRPNARWVLDFVLDQVRQWTALSHPQHVDDVTRECVGAIPQPSISRRRIARELTAIVARRASPSMIDSENDTEFTCNARGAALHRTWQPDVKWLRRELQRTNAPPAVERNNVLRSQRRPCQDYHLSPRLKFAATAFIAAIPYSDGLRRHLSRNGRSAPQP
jgi:transposase InsO family protein